MVKNAKTLRNHWVFSDSPINRLVMEKINYLHFTQ